MNDSTALVQQLAASDLFREYEQAYCSATGMPVALRPVETFELPFRGRRRENPFCALMARKSRACAACLVTQERLRQEAADETATTTCDLGLCEAAVPVKLGDKVIGFLQTGQVFNQKPSAEKVEKAVAHAVSLGVEETPADLRQAYLETPVVPREKFSSMLRLLHIFAELLSMKSNQIVVAENNAEHPTVVKAKQLIEERLTEELSLGQIAQDVHVSPFHLCKLFRRSTGMTFTEYVSRRRTEKAKSLLLNPQLRVSEIVYEVGFQSLTHFNRIFKKLVGESPTRFRARARVHVPLRDCLVRRQNAKVLVQAA